MTSPGKNRGDIIEEKWNQGRQVNSRAQRKRPKEKRKEEKTKCPNAASSCHQTRIIERKYLSKVQSVVHEACRGASRDHGASLFLRLGFDIVGEPRLEKWSSAGQCLFDLYQGGENTYQSLENTSTVCRDTGRNIPQLVLQFGQLELLSNFFWAQVFRNRLALNLRERNRKRKGGNR